MVLPLLRLGVHFTLNDCVQDTYHQLLKAYILLIICNNLETVRDRMWISINH